MGPLRLLLLLVRWWLRLRGPQGNTLRSVLNVLVNRLLMAYKTSDENDLDIINRIAYSSGKGFKGRRGIRDQMKSDHILSEKRVVRIGILLLCTILSLALLVLVPVLLVIAGAGPS